MLAYIYLMVAIICEVTATTALKFSDGMTKLSPVIIVIVGYSLAFWLMSLSLRTLPVSVIYAIWSGIGIVGIAIIGVFIFKEPFGSFHYLGTLLIIIGVIILTAITKHA